MELAYICLMYLTIGGYCYPVFYKRRTSIPEKASFKVEHFREPLIEAWSFNDYASTSNDELEATTVAASSVNNELQALKKVANIMATLGEQVHHEDSAPTDKNSIIAGIKNALSFQNRTINNRNDLTSALLDSFNSDKNPVSDLYLKFFKTVPSPSVVPMSTLPSPVALTAMKVTRASEMEEDMMALKKVAQILVLLGERVIPHILEGPYIKGCAQKTPTYEDSQIFKSLLRKILL